MRSLCACISVRKISRVLTEHVDADHRRSFVGFDPWTVGKPITGTLVARDVLGQHRLSGGDTFLLLFFGLDSKQELELSSQILDNHDGSYSVECHPPSWIELVQVQLGIR